MKLRKMGRTDLRVSEIGLNAVELGWAGDDRTALAVLDDFLAAGGTFIEASGFCPKPGADGRAVTFSEDLVGRWHHARKTPRDRLILSSRIDFCRPAAGGSVAFADLIRQCCEQSLRRLKTDYLDVLVCDWNDELHPVDDVLDAFDSLVRAGNVRQIAAGKFAPWRVADAISRAGIRNRNRFEGVHSEYSLFARRRCEAETFAMCEEYRLGFVARQPLADGAFARLPLSGTGTGDGVRRSYKEWDDGSRRSRVLMTVSAIAEKRAVSPVQVALAWVLACPQVTSALIGITSGVQLNELVRATGLVLADDEKHRLADAASVSAGGPIAFAGM